MTDRPSPENPSARSRTTLGEAAPKNSAAEDQTEAARLIDLLEPTVQARRLYLEKVTINVAGSQRTIHVVVDLPDDETGGVSLDVISEISRELLTVLDEDPHADRRPYDLEVSSPGVGRPLTEPRHWRRARGRVVNVSLLQGEGVVGRLLEVDDDGVTLLPEITVKKGMKPKQGEPTKISFARIRKGTVEVEFSHLDDVELEDFEDQPATAHKASRGTTPEEA